MTAQIIEFPNQHRVSLIRRNARVFATYSSKGADNAMNALPRQQREKLERRGLPPAYIEREIASMRAEILREIAQRRGGREVS